MGLSKLAVATTALLPLEVYELTTRVTALKVLALLINVAIVVYLLVAKRMYIDAPEQMQPVPVPRLLGFCIFVCAAGVVVMGLYPKPVVMAALRAATGLF